MKVIWKFEIPFPRTTEPVALETPVEWQPLSLQVQDGTPVLWAIVNPESLRVQRSILVVGTGWDIPEDRTIVHLGTYQTNHGQFVWHVFDCPMRAEVLE